MASSSASGSSSSSSQPPYPLHPSIVNRLHPEYREFYNRYIINRQLDHLQPIDVTRERARASGGALLPGAGPLQKVASTIDRTITRVESTGDPLPVRVFTPLGDKPAAGWPVCLFFHGGGWVFGNIDTENVIPSHLCARGRAVVVSVDYRLAPENPFPDAVLDAWESFVWITNPRTVATLNIDTTKIAVSGSSAGGNLSAVLSQMSIDRLSPYKISLQLLAVPVMDNTADSADTNQATRSWAQNQHTPALTPAKMLWFRAHYIPQENLRKTPRASPLYWKGDWSKLPPAYIVVGDLDILRDEGIAYGGLLNKAGVFASITVMEGMPHPFIALDGVLQAGKEAIAILSEALRETFE